MTDKARMTTDIVAAFVASHVVEAEEVPGLIHEVHAALAAAAAPPAPSESKPEPAVPVRRSVTPDYLICLEDGKKFKTLRRHLKSSYGLTPEEYRARWGLPHDYPMVAPNYAETRSVLAKKSGLNAGPASRADAAPADVAAADDVQPSQSDVIGGPGEGGGG